MKDLTHKELEDAPPKVQFIYLRAITKQPIGATLFNEAIKEHPEYFPEEVESRRKWAAVPQEVHDAYWKEYWKLDKKIPKDIPHLGMGILYYGRHPEEYAEYNKAMNVANIKARPLREKLHKKYYSKYGIDWCGV